ncbi:MAG TPA: cytochrome-c peroxidase [Deltaproteobacteria bacterium]|nr:cytochrome-c peroxidase [Deltaproteobacteria bacterium]
MTLSLVLSALFACGETAPELESPEGAEPVAEGGAPAEVPAEAEANKLRSSASAVFAALPKEVPNPDNPISDAKIELGRMLYYERRLSRADDLSCNSCHKLDGYGVDNEPTSPGHEGQRGARNSPTVYNAALHATQFWDGRAKDVEAQAMGPILNPVEMAMEGPEAVMEKLSKIEGYRELFATAFPGEEEPMTYDNVGKAIGAFERRLLTPSPFDAWLGGDDTAMSEAQLAGLQLFMDTGCTTCHSGPALGGQLFMKLGQVRPYETKDAGRFEVTNDEADRHLFKVPSLRNVAKTAPYLHDGSISSLEEMVRLMAAHQLGKDLKEPEIESLVAFLEALTGELPTEYIKEPELPGQG